MRNRIINGAMVIDQRNAGAAVTLNAGNIYTVDRFRSGTNGTWTSAVFAAQQNRGSVTTPAGFNNYVGVATTTADASPASGTTYDFVQWIEGFNIADLGWGTANAKTVTLSFQVYSNLTGTFGGNIQNSASNRNYTFSYSIPVANTWTQISVTIAGDTTGTWLTTNGSGLRVNFSLGAGSTYLGTAGSWGSTAFSGVTGQQQICASTSNYLYLTGVQLEVGTQATSFEYRQFGTELILCQRYFQKTYALETAVGAATGANSYSVRNQDSTSSRTTFAVPVSWKQDMRASPTLTLYTLNGASGSVSIDGTPAGQSSTSTVTNVYGIGSKGIAGFDVNAGVGALSFFNFQYTVSAEL
jgi:hypothetical protein